MVIHNEDSLFLRFSHGSVEVSIRMNDAPPKAQHVLRRTRHSPSRGAIRATGVEGAAAMSEKTPPTPAGRNA
jgi:hypothetical protein